MFELSDDELDDLGPLEDILALRVIKADLDQSCGLFSAGPPLTLVAVDFFDYSTVHSNFFGGFRPQYSYTAQYRVQVDDFFIKHLEGDHAMVEVRMLGIIYTY